MTRIAPKLLDLYGGAGGAGRGYMDAGFDVTGVDIEPQPDYPGTFILGDALAYLAAHGHEYDAIHASPPLPSVVRTVQGNEQGQLLPEPHTGHEGTSGTTGQAHRD